MKLLHRIPAWVFLALLGGVFAADFIFAQAMAGPREETTKVAVAVVSPQSVPGKFRCSAVSVLTTPTTVISGASDHNAWLIQNLGPNPIYCNGDPSITVSTSNSVQVPASGGVLTSDVYGRYGKLGNDTIICVAATASQSTPNDTRKCEVF